jgi:hypothetical protein
MLRIRKPLKPKAVAQIEFLEHNGHSCSTTSLLIEGGTVIGVVVGTAKAFDWFQGMVSDKARQGISSWLVGEYTEVSQLQNTSRSRFRACSH